MRYNETRAPSNGAFYGDYMRPLKRSPVKKFRSARKFRRQSARTKAANVKMIPRGGYRL